MSVSIREMLDFLAEEGVPRDYAGDLLASAERVCALNEPAPRGLTWIKRRAAFDIRLLDPALNLVIVTDVFADAECYNVIRCPYPKEGFFDLVRRFFAAPELAEPVIGRNVRIGAHCHIGRGVVIEDDVTIHNNVSIDCPAVIGRGSVLYSGVVVGADGFGYYRAHDGSIRHVPHLGGVKIGRRVEIGANTCVDRGTLGDTVIGDDTKIDNLCQIAHNVRVGRGVILTAGTIVYGSVVIGDGAYVAGGFLLNQIEVGGDALVGAASVALRDVPAGMKAVGNPARVIGPNDVKLL